MTNLYSKAIMIQEYFKYLPIDFNHFFPRFLYSLICLIFLIILRHSILYFFRLRVKNIQARITWKLTSFYIIVFLYILSLIVIWFSSLANLLTILSILGTGIIVVSKEVIQNIFGWFYIVIRRPFELGNRILINNHIGDVLEIRILDFVMIEVQSINEGGQSTGKILHIPNALVFTHALSNASKEFSFNWNEIKIPLEPESDWHSALNIIEKTANEILEKVEDTDQRILEAEERYAIHYAQLKHAIYIDFQEGAINLYLRFLTEPRSVRSINDKIWRELLKNFSKNKKIILKRKD